MGTNPSLQTEIVTKVRESLQHAEAQVKELRRRNSRFASASILFGALGTAVAGTASTTGPVIGQGAGAWKLTCLLTAAFTASATIFSALNQQLSVPDRLAKATACAGHLRALELDITLRGQDLAQVTKAYEELVERYSEFMF